MSDRHRVARMNVDYQTFHIVFYAKNWRFHLLLFEKRSDHSRGFFSGYDSLLWKFVLIFFEPKFYQIKLKLSWKPFFQTIQKQQNFQLFMTSCFLTVFQK